MHLTIKLIKYNKIQCKIKLKIKKKNKGKIKLITLKLLLLEKKSPSYWNGKIK